MREKGYDQTPLPERAFMMSQAAVPGRLVLRPGRASEAATMPDSGGSKGSVLKIGRERWSEGAAGRWSMGREARGSNHALRG